MTSLVGAGFDANIWWIDLRWAPMVVRVVGLMVFAGAMINYAVGWKRGPIARSGTGAIIAVVMLLLWANTVEFYWLMGQGVFSSRWMAPITLFIALLLMGMFMGALRPGKVFVKFRDVLAGSVVFAGMFAFLQMMAFGRTDYTRRSDVAVVLGARVYADGRLSDALMDRVNTACRLYRDGYVRALVFSGGPGDGPVHETEAMKRLALLRGVPESAIVLDYGGVNTRSTARNTAKIFRKEGVRRVIVVSHFYHLPRVKLAYQQEGWDVFTVPARSDRTLLKLPVFMAREEVAMVAYYLEPLVGAALGKPI